MTPSDPRPALLRPALRRIALGLMTVMAIAACTPGPSASPTLGPRPASPTLGPRPASPATVEIISPARSTTLAGPLVHVVLRLNGARIVTEASTTLRPDEGHIHLYVNGSLVSMNYGLEQDISVQPGTTAIKAEFVAADHAPFSPRVWSADTVVTVN